MADTSEQAIPESPSVESGPHADSPPSFLARLLNVATQGMIPLSIVGWGLFLGLVFWRPYAQPQKGPEPEKPTAHLESPPVLSGLGPAAKMTPEQLDEVARHQLKVADELLRDGSGSRAMEIYATLSRRRELQEPFDVLAFRLALAREVGGDLGLATRLYRELVRASENPRVVTAAILGQARILIRQEHLAAARLLVYRALALPSVSAQPDSELVAELFHLLGILDAQELLQGRCDALLDDRSCAFVGPHWSVEQMLAMLLPRASSTAKPISQGEVELVATAELPSDITMSLCLRDRPLHELTDALASRSGVACQWSSRAERLVAAETGSLVANGIELGVIYDLVCVAHGLVWKLTPEGVRIQALDELDEKARLVDALERAERELRSACRRFPQHRFFAHAALGLGNLHFLRKNLSAAEEDYRLVLNHRGNTSLAVYGAFNLAKTLMALGRGEEALKAFYQSVDLGTGHPLRPAAYAYIGRLHLERGELNEAIRPLMRGLALSEQDPARATLAVTLAGAYLLAENPHAANKVLMEYRQLIAASTQRPLGAMLGSLSRFTASRDPAKINERGRSLVEAVTEIDATESFGMQVRLLVGMTLDTLGLATQTAALYEETLKAPVPVWVGDQMRHRLAGHYHTLGDHSKTAAMLHELAGSPNPSMAQRARFELAELALTTADPNDCANACYDLLESPDKNQDLRVETLRLLGQAFALQGDHEHAALCFAGLIPQGRPLPRSKPVPLAAPESSIP